MASEKAIEKVFTRINQRGNLACSCIVRLPDGSVHKLGDEEPAFELLVRNKLGLKAFLSLDQLAIGDAYCHDNIDVQGDMVKALGLQEILSQKSLWIKIWRWLKPILIGHKRCNPAWIAKHYDADNLQIIATDDDFDSYTPGIYKEGETLEKGIKRKLDFAFQSLKLKPDDSMLDIGCGWGSFTRFAVQRGVNVTGITLSKHQKEYTEQIILNNKLTNAQVHYQDFFHYQTDKQYDGISMMGVIEHLSDYRKVIKHLVTLLKPGGRVYLDFATSVKRFGTSVFITKYIWPGTFRMVYLPEFIDAVNKSPFEIDSMYNDRLNYYHWSRLIQKRWIKHKEKILKQANESVWRLFNILFAGTAAIQSSPSYRASAYRVVLELPADHKALA